MIGRVFVLVILCTSARSLPVTSGHLESEDVKVLKCIVEALADVLSKPRPLPVSPDCLRTLTTDGRLVALLRHQNFLKELQEIALEGSQKGAQEDAPLQPTRRTDDTPDRSMLESLGGPGERSMVSQEKRGERRGGGEVQDPPEERAERVRAEESEKRGRQEKKGSEDNEKRASTRTKTASEKGEEREESSSLHSLQLDEKREGEDKRGDERREREREEKRSGLKLWSKRTKSAEVQKKATEEETEKRAIEEVEVPHHSKEMTDQEVETAERRSPEEEELQLIARTAAEEEGSGSKKEVEIESLATIESELESVAQKLHELSRAERGQQRT